VVVGHNGKNASATMFRGHEVMEFFFLPSLSSNPLLNNHHPAVAEVPLLSAWGQGRKYNFG
jgi:hypothetical protein